MPDVVYEKPRDLGEALPCCREKAHLTDGGQLWALTAPNLFNLMWD